MHEVKFAI